MTPTTIADIKTRIKSGESIRAIIEETLENFEKAAEYNTLISLARESALKHADELDDRLKKGENIGPLGGVPYVAKDIFLAQSTITTAGSNMLREFDSPYQATCVNRLEAAGAIW